MTHERRFTATLVLGLTIGMASLFPVAAAASDDGWAHRSPETTSADGWAVRTQPAPAVDGWAVGSSDAPRLAAVKDGFQVSMVELPQTQIIRDGWAAASSDAPRLAAVKDGFQVSMVELPQTQIIRDGWEVATVELPRTASAVAAATPAPPARAAITTAELIAVGLASVTTIALLIGMTMGVRRHRHHAI